jgi:hypothetical protein
MVTTIEAVFDGKVFHPNDPLRLEPNTRVRLTIETVQPAADKGASFLQIARSLNLEGPPAWAVNLDAYLWP